MSSLKYLKFPTTLLFLLVTIFVIANKPERVLAQSPSPDSKPTVPAVSEETPIPSEEQEPSIPATSLDNIEVEKLDADLKTVTDRFGKLDSKTHQAMFDSKEARKAGIDNDIIKLAEELVNYQNNLVEDLREGKARIGDKVKPSPQKYPRLRKFHQRAADKFKKTKASSFKLLNPGNEEKLLTFDTNFYAVNTETACGNYAFPKPNKVPVRYFYNQSNPAPSSWLLNNGFHVTASYATGNYQNNYTRETFYSGVQGTCDSPKFRDDGTAGNGTTSNGAFYNMNIQYKEPNPEILELYYGLWPYLGWGTYVQWWHNTY